MNSTPKALVPSNLQDSWAPLLRLSAEEVFGRMLGSELATPAEPFADNAFNITSMVGLAGCVCGLITLRCDLTAAGLMASKMLGIDVAGDDQQLFDAIGEICNMVAGNFKNKIAGMGDGCQLSLPTVITGEDYSCHPVANDWRIHCQFLFEARPIVFSLEVTR